MEAQSYTAQERRAANQVWAAAGAYGFEPLFLAHNTDGTVDFYMNTIVGLVHKYYGDKLISSIFDRWAGDLRQAMLDDLAWLYLENAAYRLELPHRPVLEALRSSHADYFFAIQYKLSRQEWMARNQLVYTMQAARWRSVLGRNLPVMTPYESGLFRALAPDTAPQPDQLQDALLAVYAAFDLFDGTVHPKAALHLHLDGLLATLNEQYPDNAFVQNEVSNVDATIGKEFMLKSIVALVAACVLILLYVAYRFRRIGGLKAGSTAIVALLHDMLVVFGVFVILRIPLNGNFIAALLTILGYSINDTVVIYDRIRENSALYSKKQMSLAELVNLSVNQSFARSLMTSITTCLALGVVCIVSVIYRLDSIYSFAFPLLFGMVSGVYSTICIATPLWVDWKTKKKAAKQA